MRQRHRNRGRSVNFAVFGFGLLAYGLLPSKALVIVLCVVLVLCGLSGRSRN